MATRPPIVVVHQDEHGELSVFSDEGVVVFWIDERSPDDRVYEMTHNPIPSGMLRGLVGRQKDGSSADAKAHALVARMEGKPHLTVARSTTHGT